MIVEWGPLRAVLAGPAEVAPYVDALSAAYNDPANAPLLGNTEIIAPDDVLALYAESAAQRSFLFFDGDALAGDGDLRGIRGQTAEFAFLIASPAAQGKGFGTRFATMVHAAAFGAFGLAHVYASVVPANTASLRVFEKLGYARDDSPTARAYADEPGDLVLGIARDAFLGRHAAALAEIRVIP
ncbi:MAG TPA: GNAT family protein [Kofleriaceae bacterium]